MFRPIRLVICAAILMTLAEAHPDGAPASACDTMLPWHKGTKPQARAQGKFCNRELSMQRPRLQESAFLYYIS